MAGNARLLRKECGAMSGPRRRKFVGPIVPALRGTAGGGAVPPQMGPYHRSRGAISGASRLETAQQSRSARLTRPR